MTYQDRLEEKVKALQQEVEKLRERDRLHLDLHRSYSYMVRKYQMGKTVNRQNFDEIQDLKNKLGIGNGVLKNE